MIKKHVFGLLLVLVGTVFLISGVTVAMANENEIANLSEDDSGMSADCGGPEGPPCDNAPRTGSYQADINFTAVPAAAFDWDGSDAFGSTYFKSFSSGALTGHSTTNTTCFLAPVHIPVNAEIRSFFVSLDNGNASGNVDTTLRRISNLGVQENIASVIHTANSGFDSLKTAVDPVVLNDASGFWAYYITTCLFSDTRLYS